MNNNIIDYHVIHLRNSQYSEIKYENILKNEALLKQKIKIYDAIVGKNALSGKKQLTSEYKDINFKFKFQHVGEVGCYLSHLLLIKSLIDSSSKYSVIFEDDFEILDDNLHDSVSDIVKKVDDIDFDIIYLGNLNDNHDKQIVDNIYTINTKELFWGTHAYILNVSKAEKIYKSLLHFNAAIDNKFKKNITDRTMKAYVIYPILVDQNNEELKSDIRPDSILSTNKKSN
jgi:glycosyl transferase family 25